MSAPATANPEPIGGLSDLVTYFETGCKAPDAWRIGTEHEKFVFRTEDFSRPAYGDADGIREFLTQLRRFGWEPLFEGDTIAALRRSDGGMVTYEPGGQLELSGAMLSTVHQTCAEIHDHLDQVRVIAKELGLGLLGMGCDPSQARDKVPFMPRERHRIMRNYMPKRGQLGIDMMLRTCTVQVNLDYGSEADMVKKLRVSLALQPLAMALFASSPFLDGKPTGYVSYRNHIWTDTDPDRCGQIPFAFEEGMGFERYASYALDVPMYFVFRDGRYHDVAGASFRDFMAGRLPGLSGIKPTMAQWTDHLSTLFPDVRLKRFLEQRGADSGPWNRLCALPALWVGLLYDSAALDEAWHMVKTWSDEDRRLFRISATRDGLMGQAPDGLSIAELARRVLAVARKGLDHRQRLDNRGRTEAHFLDALDEIADCGESPSAAMVKLYESEWHRSVSPAYTHCAF